MENKFKCEICKTAYTDKSLAEKCMRQCRDKNAEGLKLSPQQENIMRKKGTEAPFSSSLLYNKEKGIYVCADCGNKIFESKTKFDSGTGWPSFYEAIKESVELKEDDSLAMKRVEVICRRCKSHLGHVFDDGPKPTGKRYCVNGAALNFKNE